MKLVLLVCSLLIVAYTPAQSGDLGSPYISSGMGWESSDCSRPMQPSFYVTDADDFNNAVDEFNNYVQDVKQFISCVENEADDDAQAVVQAIESGRDDEVSDVSSEVDDARSSLEMQRPY